MNKKFSHQALNLSSNKPLIYTATSKYLFYFRAHISKFVVEKWGVPLNPFMLFDYFLLDSVDRDTVRSSNNTLVFKADEVWVFWPVSNWVLAEIKMAKKFGRPIKYFVIQKSQYIVSVDKDNVEMEDEVKEFRNEL